MYLDTTVTTCESDLYSSTTGFLCFRIQLLSPYYLYMAWNVSDIEWIFSDWFHRRRKEKQKGENMHVNQINWLLSATVLDITTGRLFLSKHFHNTAWQLETFFKCKYCHKVQSAVFYLNCFTEGSGHHCSLCWTVFTLTNMALSLSYEC